MLLIGDIHITTKHCDAILDSINEYVASFPGEKNVIFMGDYMYMFSYDRRALGRLFDLFLRLWDQGKNVYILAGNHDRIGQQFVYAEGKKIADMLPQHSGRVIRFITTPELHTIEGKDILFFPFSKHVSLPKEIGEGDTTTGSNNMNSNETISRLLASKNSNERLSGEINMILNGYIEKNPRLTIIHHYYMADTKFPGQQAIFDYKDIALCPDLLDNENIQMISGHIHMPFAYKNYLCTGSIWYTSPLEQDHHKFLYQRDVESNTINAQQVAINPYITLAVNGEDTKISASLISTHRQAIDQKISETFGNSSWKVKLNFSDYPLARTHVTLLSEGLSYDTLHEKIDTTLLHTVQEWAIKKKSPISADMSFTLEVAQRNLQESLVDRKTIVKEFIMSRYGEDFDKYRTVLDELQIL